MAKALAANTNARRLVPFYVYIDECQNFITLTIAKNSFDQARGLGLHLTLANQYPSQFLNAGLNGKAMYDSILVIAETKIIFQYASCRHGTVAKWLFMGTFNTDEIKLKLMSTKVMGYREECARAIPPDALLRA